jgi:4-hydroxybenzoate polyprenyltransferase
MNDNFKNLPLVVDLDGTMIMSDSLVESVVIFIKKSLFNLLMIPLWLSKGKATFKCKIANHVTLDVNNLPYNQRLLDYLNAEKIRGRRIILATAAHKSIAEAISKKLGLFENIIATNLVVNMKGKNKLEAIKTLVGKNFVYAGNSSDDIPIWMSAKAAILVNTSNKINKLVKGIIPVEQEFNQNKIDIYIWLKAIRIHQWLKNLLLFVPMLAAFVFFDLNKLGLIILAFFAFSFAASATYIFNDLLDLENDRNHYIKKHRPFASGQLSISIGFIVALILVTVGIYFAHLISNAFLIIVLSYLILANLYSYSLKKILLIDTIVLSILYILRIISGSIALEINTSAWLLVFSFFIFLSLALVKRCTELISLEMHGKEYIDGRDYKVSDIRILCPLGVCAGLIAVLVLTLFINDQTTQNRYKTPELLWINVIIITYWISRIWLKTIRGEVHSDPVIFTIDDSISRVTIFLLVVILIISQFINLNN